MGVILIGVIMIGSKEEWDKLTELKIANTNDSNEGQIYHVKKVGFVRHKSKEAIEILPLVHLKNGQICKLPQELSGWAYNSVALAHGGTNVYPANVEFGIQDNEYYAEII